ncbi:MAG: porin [Xanthobacteraceae bacterium]
MKMVKSLLLGSAAALAAVTAGQAADLPVKAKPVEYVKVCSLYGAGFYYMPGTDICLKIGGYVRAETTYHSNGNFAGGPTAGDVNNRNTSEFVMRARAYITADSREQSSFGTIRTYFAVGIADTDTGPAIAFSPLFINRAFIQWAGLTAGITQSFFDFYSSAAVGYRAYLPSSDTGDSGWWLFAYTAQLGNGLSASISAEQRRMSQIIGLTDDAFVSAASGTASLVAGALATNGQGYGGLNVPDIVGNIRLDQTWGSAQIMGAAHQVNAPYYGVISTTAAGSLSETGHPGDQWGFVAGAGLRLNFPMITQGDYFQTQVNYTQGGLRYLNMGNNSPNFGWERGGNFGFGVMSDCVYGSLAAPIGGPVSEGTGCNLTTAWEVNASYEHYWTPQFHESFVFGYEQAQYNSQANAILCVFEGAGTGNTGSAAVAAPGCNNNWALWTGATRFQYDVTKTLYLGVEFLYSRLDTGTLPGDVLGATGLTRLGPGFSDLSAATQIKDQNNLAITGRIHKDFLP